MNWQNLDENSLWKSLVFSILSSNVYYETAKSALEQLCYKELVTDLPFNYLRNSRRLIYNELRKPLYLPKRINGSFRKYRFPRVKATQIVQAAKIIYYQHNGLRSLLKGFNSGIAAREFLSDRIPGLGYKESSHFLRNIRYSDHLAIIDIHILSFLKQISLIDSVDISLTRKVYRELEKKLLGITSNLQLSLAAFDMAVWKYMRSN
jgi:N-glycosylase/DNA lyase